MEQKLKYLYLNGIICNNLPKKTLLHSPLTINDILHMYIYIHL